MIDILPWRQRLTPSRSTYKDGGMTGKSANASTRLTILAGVSTTVYDDLSSIFTWFSAATRSSRSCAIFSAADFDSASADRGTLLSLERESVSGIRALILEMIERLAANDFEFLEGIKRKEDNTRT